MKARLLLITLLVLFVFVLPVTAQPPDPLDDTIEDITSGFEDLPGLAGLGPVVALLVVLARRFGLPDGLGGKASWVVGGCIYIAVVVLPDDIASQIFEGAKYLAAFLLVILGSAGSHKLAKYAELDSLWKGGDNDQAND